MASWMQTVIEARLLVGSLGEATAPPWWRSQATLPAGRRFLGLLFPRTAMLASLQTVGRAAMLEHDARVGRHGVFHLFRLPVADEAAVTAFLSQADAASLLAPLASLTERQDRLAALCQRAGSAQPVEGSGPVHCGSPRGVRGAGLLRCLCATYLAAFEDGRPRYPYLEERQP